MDNALRGEWVKGEERVSAWCHEKSVVSLETNMKQNGENSLYFCIANSFFKILTIVVVLKELNNFFNIHMIW